MFHIGQKVVCIQRAKNSKLVLNEIYTIRDFWHCCTLNIDVGISDDLGLYCVDCSQIKDTGVYFFRSDRFAPLDEWQEADEAIKELMKEINEPVKIKQ